MGAGGATSVTGKVYDQCQIMDSNPGLDLETGAGIILADHSRHGGDPSREGWPVVGDDRVINNEL
ncbi:hypothetical protein TIFTF001_019383 [Ficus carica]|uniref:Uncharacterized protein n=1 Tax=Ficus carica TaxID=3494 RepID=A0AA88AE84_FICCA|nr:hypothetical protein TIFTF001_019383 [Ficus carica]